jgi:hypothetical protein
MKTLKIITSLILLFSMQTLLAQYGQGGMGQGGYGQGGYGQGGMGGNNMNNPNQMGNQTRSQAPKERPIEEVVAKVVERLKKQLTLDELQVIAVSNIITDNMKKQNAVLKKEDNNDEKTAELKAISEKTDLDILILLNKDQKTKYKLLSEDAKKMQEASMRKGR